MPRAKNTSVHIAASRRASASVRSEPGQQKTTAKLRTAYHHGDLRQALLDAAERLLEEQGVQGLTLRECARRAGVSHGAPAHHFGDVGGLLRALRRTCYERFGDHLAAARDAAASEPFEQLLAIGLAYVDFALRFPAHFRLMFATEKLGLPSLADAEEADRVPTFEELQEDDRAYRILGECITATDRAGGGDGTLLREKAVLAQVLVHGFGTLVLENPTFYSNLRSSPIRARAFLERLLRLARPAFESTRIVEAKTRRRRSRQ